MGRPMQAIFPAVPIPTGTRSRSARCPTAGACTSGCSPTRRSCPDAVDVAREVEKAFDVLQVAALAAPRSSRGAARRRRAPAGVPDQPVVAPGQPAASR
jgi:hypothetical protein